MIPALITFLLSKGLPLIANAVFAKGKEFFEEKIGVKFDQDMTDDDLSKVRQYEMEHEEELARLKLEDNRISADLEKAYLGDIQSARSMQTAALQQGDTFSKRFIYYFAIFWTVCAIAYVFAVTFFKINPDSIRFADTTLGFLLGTVMSTIVNFFYGSSRSSQHKDEVIKDAVQQNKSVNQEPIATTTSISIDDETRNRATAQVTQYERAGG